MTNPDDDAGRNERSEPPAGGSEPQFSGHEAASGEQSPAPRADDDTPPAYNPPPSGYSQPPGSSEPSGYSQPSGYPPPGYPPPSGYTPPQSSGYPPPYGDAGSTPYQGYGQPSYPPPPPYGPGGYPSADLGYGAPVSRGTNQLAIASLVASILGVCCGIGSIVGIVLGIIAINQIKERGQDGHGLAVAGIAVGAVTLLISLVWTVSVIAS